MRITHTPVTVCGNRRLRYLRGVKLRAISKKAHSIAVPKNAPYASCPLTLQRPELVLHCPMLVSPGTARPTSEPVCPPHARVQSASELHGCDESSRIRKAIDALAMGTNVKDVPTTQMRPVPRKKFVFPSLHFATCTKEPMPEKMRPAAMRYCTSSWLSRALNGPEIMSGTVTIDAIIAMACCRPMTQAISHGMLSSLPKKGGGREGGAHGIRGMHIHDQS
mmetsp:Transcript_56252/g.137983  ORF Transcript_56252/g.137983 Transcript_56252/m.137983 type:complete len:221 (-) Transcript_56252:58-720(-)